jgi:hypothetical protein
LNKKGGDRIPYFCELLPKVRRFFAGFVRDASERKRAEEALKVRADNRTAVYSRAWLS